VTSSEQRAMSGEHHALVAHCSLLPYNGANAGTVEKRTGIRCHPYNSLVCNLFCGGFVVIVGMRRECRD
jgi:hypothetical protein